jgi:predicted transposase YdaD
VAKRYDATFKQLVEAHPADWIAFVGLPPGTDLAVVEAELSSITAAADKVIRVGGPAPYIAHLEFQAGPDPDIDRRVLLYNVLLRWRHNLPVRSIVLLLQPKAMTPHLAGGVTDVDAPDWLLEFRFRIIRVWEQPTALFMSGPIGTLPLAPVTLQAGSEQTLAGVLERIAERVRREAGINEARELWAATLFLSGLRHDLEIVERLMKGVWNVDLEESVTYQAAVARGVTKGRLEEARRAVLLVGRRRFGEPPPFELAKLERITDAERLETLLDRLLITANWQELLADEN